MKEGFAIFYALKKWEYLLRNRKFTILTDHRNLTQLRADHGQQIRQKSSKTQCQVETRVHSSIRGHSSSNR